MRSIAYNRVKNGARLLDNLVPGWANLVETASLDLGSSSNCVLGQLFGTYEDGLRALGLNEYEDAASVGFNLGFAELTYQPLLREWKRHILAQRL
jgi:hypothetical protein